MNNRNINNLNAIAEKTMLDHKMIFDEAHIVIGLSGGPDSVCLFDILCNLSAKYSLHLYPVHINHCLRGEDADRDQRYAEELAKSRGLVCRSFKEDCLTFAHENQLSTEESGRIIRYRIFSKLADEILEKEARSDRNIAPVLIALGQHADDRAETVLFRIIKGTGTDGLVGIEYSRYEGKDKKIIRPLLDIYKDDIRAYCRARSLHPCEDLTNRETVYERNSIRLDLIPKLEEAYNPKIKEALNRLAEAAEEDRSYLEDEALKAYRQCLISIDKEGKRLLLDGKILKSLAYPISRRVIRMAFADIGLTQDIRYSHYEACREIIHKDDPSALTHLPHGYFLMNRYDEVLLAKKDHTEEIFNGGRLTKSDLGNEEYKSFGDFEYRIFSNSTEKIVSKKDNVDLLSKESSCKIKCFDIVQIEKDLGQDAVKRLQVRSRKPGDKIRLAAGSRKLQKLFIDKKIPRGDRDKVMVLAIDNDVVAIAWMDCPPELGGNKMHFMTNPKWESDGNSQACICIELHPRI